jgi:7-cyano-7-deazaguanine synthase in queuosine biosynthesis
MKKVVLFSGGPDALIAWEYLGRPEALYIQHGCRYEHKQLKAVMRIRALLDRETAKKIHISPSYLRLGDFEEEDANLPLRNMYFCMVATNLTYEYVWLTVQRGEQSIPDRSPEFLERLSKELSIQMGKCIKVDCIFNHLTKQDMVKWYLDNGHDIELLKSTTSCFHPIHERCGECAACFRRFCAFEYNGIHEKYHKDIKKWTGIQTYIDKMKAGKYDKERTQQTLEVLKRHHLI